MWWRLFFMTCLLWPETSSNHPDTRPWIYSRLQLRSGDSFIDYSNYLRIFQSTPNPPLMGNPITSRLRKWSKCWIHIQDTLEHLKSKNTCTIVCFEIDTDMWAEVPMCNLKVGLQWTYYCLTSTHTFTRNITHASSFMRTTAWSNQVSITYVSLSGSRMSYLAWSYDYGIFW